MLLMVEKGVRGETYYSIYRQAKNDSKYMNDYGKGKELPCLQYWDVNKKSKSLYLIYMIKNDILYT